MSRQKIKRLSYSERVKIETLLKEKRSLTYIANELDRSISTISREVKKWRGSRFNYNATIAHDYASTINRYKGRGTKLERNPRLKSQVYKGLIEKLSPEAISGRLAVVFPDDPSMQLSYESIYRHIYLHPQGRMNKNLIQLLCHKKSRRRKKRKQDRHRVKIQSGISIEQRPLSAENRIEIGHWEGDLVMGIRQKSCIGTIVDRKSRYTLLVKLNGRKSKEVCTSFSETLAQLPEQYRKTMTYDNGSEMAEHEYITEKTGVKVFFAHPYSSWERGTNENTNGLIRRFYPKKSTDFNRVTFKELQQLQDHLNNRPRKVLGYHTPREMFEYELRKNKVIGDAIDDSEGLKTGNKSSKDLFSFLMPGQQPRSNIYS